MINIVVVLYNLVRLIENISNGNKILQSNTHDRSILYTSFVSFNIMAISDSIIPFMFIISEWMNTQFKQWSCMWGDWLVVSSERAGLGLGGVMALGLSYNRCGQGCRSGIPNWQFPPRQASRSVHVVSQKSRGNTCISLWPPMYGHWMQTLYCSQHGSNLAFLCH